MTEIKRFDFTIESREDIKNLSNNDIAVGENWPVVYVINDEEEAYVGQTTNAFNRTQQHLDNPQKNYLTEIRVISDPEFNVSVTLDLESYLIKHMSADKKYTLLNRNPGLVDHEYYDRERYKNTFNSIWEQLRELGVAQDSIKDIENSEMFKYSPYKSLGSEQKEAEWLILKALADDENATVIVRGGAGTGKTILAVYLIKLLADELNSTIQYDEDNYDEFTDEAVYVAENLYHIEKMALVIPQKSLRDSLKDVFSKVNGLSPDMVKDPNGIMEDFHKTQKKFDLLIVDEGHRLKTRKNHGNFNLRDNINYKKWCEIFGVDLKNGSELDLLMKCSKSQIVFRDDKQTVKASDMTANHFNEVTNASGKEPVTIGLFTQWRCKGGKEYTDYVRDILSQKADRFLEVEDYDFRLYDDVDEMVNDIKALNEEMGLCRNAAGYAWEWKTKNLKKGTAGIYDIEIGDYKYIWNSTQDSWILSTNAINEIGCIHTVQGFDLNYLGVIIGEDLKYDEEKGGIYADINNYYDSLGRTGLTNDPEALKDYITNIYATLMTRGIHGTYIYVCDPALRKYMANFIDMQDE